MNREKEIQRNYLSISAKISMIARKKWNTKWQRCTRFDNDFIQLKGETCDTILLFYVTIVLFIDLLVILKLPIAFPE